MKEFKFNIGTDPEFNIILQNNRISAENLIKTLFKDKTDNNSMGYKVEGAGVFGWDGASATGELRPIQEKSPKKLCDNIETLLKEFIKETQLFDLTTSSIKAPIGGHIHLELEGTATNESDSNIVRIHKRLAVFTLPIMLAENEINTKIRKRGNYGKINGYRIQRFGNKYTYELRSPSAEWLTSRKLAEATLAYIGVVYNEIIKPESLLKKNETIEKTKTLRQIDLIQEIAENNFEEINNMFIERIRKTIKTFELYKDFKKEIDFILSPKKVKEEKEKYDYNIIEGWNLTNKEPLEKRTILNQKKTMEKIKDKNLDSMMNMISITYNDDTNVSLFVKELKKKILAHNWKLKNEYYLFGLRKGVKGYLVKNQKNEWIGDTSIIKTKFDLDLVENIFENIKRKFQIASPLKPGQKQTKQERIMIGIPYEDRINNKTKPLISRIYEIEKKLKTTKIIRNELKEEKGDIEKEYNKKDNKDFDLKKLKANSADVSEQIINEIYRCPSCNSVDTVIEDNIKRCKTCGFQRIITQ